MSTPLRWLTSLVLVGLVVVGLWVSLRPDDRVPDDRVPDDRASDVPTSVERAVVTSHVDGDTIRLRGVAGSTLLPPRGETSVRLLEIDSPEVAGSPAGAECFGAEASAALADLLPVGAEVSVERDEDLYDPYDRMLLYLWAEDGTFVNESMVREGYARVVLFEPNDAHIGVLRRVEADARDEGAGMWGACS